jgi:hypothetical protein
VTTVEEDRTQARVDGLPQMLRDTESDFRRSYARVLEVVAELDAERAGAVTGFGSTARLLTGVLDLSQGEAKALRIGERLLAHLDPDGSIRPNNPRPCESYRPHWSRGGGRRHRHAGPRRRCPGAGSPQLPQRPPSRSGWHSVYARPARRNADALVEAMSSLLDDGQLPTRSDSMPLDVGRQQRLATAALRDALTQRDKGCAFPSAIAHPVIVAPATLSHG